MSSLPGYRGPINPTYPTPDGEARIVIYNYVPSLAFNVVAVVLFGIAMIGHGYLFALAGKKRAERVGRGRSTRWFEGLWLFGCIMEVIGYGFRLASHYNPFVVGNFVAQYFLIVVAPVFFAAALYLSLQHTINLSPSNLALSPVKKLFVTIFIVIDSVTTVIQVVGAALIGVAESARSRGEGSKGVTSEQANDILLSGLALQNASFLIFLIIIAVIIYRISKSPTGFHRSPTGRTPSATEKLTPGQPLASPATAGTVEHGPLVEAGTGAGHTYTRMYIVLLVVTSLLVFMRTLYRLAETAEGVWGTASSYESLFGVFEFAPVVAAAWIWMIRPLRLEMERMT